MPFRSSTEWRTLIVAFAMVMVAWVALSRVYLGAHFPSDVAAAFASSSAWLAFSLTAIFTWRKRQDAILALSTNNAARVT